MFYICTARTRSPGRRSLEESARAPGLPVELLPREDGSSPQERRPDTESRRDARVVEEPANERFDASTLENEDHGLFRQKDAVAPKARQAKPVRRPFGDDRGGALS